MRFKLDENLPVELAQLFRRAGHDASTVLEQHLGGARDADLVSVCVREKRAIVTLDTDFSDIRTYPPAAHAGLIVLRLRSQARDHVLSIAERLMTALPETTLDGELWIVEESRIRIRH